MRRFLFLLFVLLSSSTTALALPSYQEVRKSYVQSDSILLDRNGEVLQEVRIDKNRRRVDWTILKDISPTLQQAVIQSEDRRFYDHHGIDYRSIGSALFKGLSSEGLRGASTITMQMSSLLNSELHPRGPRRSIWQKGRQMLDAVEIEKGWSKEEILEAYLNFVTFRGELQGVAAASRSLFGKDPHGLDRPEALVMSSLIRSPNAPSGEVMKRASYLNRSMKWQVDESEIRSKVTQVFLGPNFLRPRNDLAFHASRLLLRGRPHGLTIRSTLSARIQRFVSDCLRHHLLSLRSQNVKDGAVLVAENRTGNVLAYVSHSGEPLHGRFVDGVQTKRQAGSTLKPFLYAAAFEARILTPASLINDSPLDIAVAGGIYQPRDYSSEFRGRVTSRTALASSLNVPAVGVLSLVGTEPFLIKLRQLGIRGLNESGDFYGPSLALGSADVSLWELVNAYRTLANEGAGSELHLTFEGSTNSKQKQIYSREAVFLVSNILSDRGARSVTFGLENPLSTRFWTAVKTGTSKDMRDNWCIGYSGEYTVGVWTGNFSGEPMWNVSGMTGSAPVWVEVMNLLHQNHWSQTKDPPDRLTKRSVEFSPAIEASREEWFIRGTEPDGRDQKMGQFNQRISYPPSGAVIALDPDIPPELQKVSFVCQAGESVLRWVLDGQRMDVSGKTVSWSPRAGKHLLSIADGEGRIIDSVHFEVRGPSEDGHF